jgi:ABC-type uncharacterized transport system involved in gliding motility auxiliary subunit
MNGGSRLLPLFLIALFLTALAGALASLSGPRAYLPRLLFLGAVLCFIVFLYRGRREILFLLVRARRVAEPGPATTWILATLVLLVGSVVLDRVPLRMDATRRNLNSLSAASRRVLSAEEAPVELIGVYRETSPERARAVDLLEVYRRAAGRVRTRMVDPDRQPDEARALGVRRASMVVVRAGAVSEEVVELSEQAITEAILRVENPRRAKIAFIAGHGERAIGDGGGAGLGKLATALRGSGYDPFETRLFEEEIPVDAAVLALVGPRRGLLPVEIDKIGRYLDGGGRMLIALEPGISCGIEDLLRTKGILLDSLEVYDESPATRGLGLGPRVVVVTDYAKHPIVAAGIGYGVLPGVRTVAVSKEALWGIDGVVLMQSGTEAHLVRVDLPGEAPGGETAARPLAVAEEWEIAGSGRNSGATTAPEKPFSRLLVVGDSDWLSVQFLDLFSNRELAMRSFHWLARREFLLRIPPIDQRGTPMRIGLGGLRALASLLQIGLPLALLGVGILLWSRRR